MVRQKKLVSVGMPIYNASAYLREALDTLLAQDHEQVEFIISDNASTDDTNDICREYMAGRDNIRLFRQDTNIGATANFEFVLHQATGDFFMWAAYDDMWEPDFISSCLAALEENARAILAYPATIFIRPGGEEMERQQEDVHTVGLAPLERYLRVAQGLNRCAAIYGVWRREAVLDTDFGKCISGDIPFMLRKSQLGEYIYLGDRRLFYNRIFPGRRAEYYTLSIDPSNQDRKWRLRFPYSEMIYEIMKMVSQLDLPLNDRLRVVWPTLLVCKQFFGLSFLREMRLDGTYLKLLAMAKGDR